MPLHIAVEQPGLTGGRSKTTASDVTCACLRDICTGQATLRAADIDDRSGTLAPRELRGQGLRRQ